MLDFEIDIEKYGKYLLIKLLMLHKYVLDLKYISFNHQIFPLQIFYITFEL